MFLQRLKYLYRPSLSQTVITTIIAVPAQQSVINSNTNQCTGSRDSGMKEENWISEEDFYELMQEVEEELRLEQGWLDLVFYIFHGLGFFIKHHDCSPGHNDYLRTILYSL